MPGGQNRAVSVVIEVLGNRLSQRAKVGGPLQARMCVARGRTLGHYGQKVAGPLQDTTTTGTTHSYLHHYALTSVDVDKLPSPYGQGFRLKLPTALGP